MRQSNHSKNRPIHLASRHHDRRFLECLLSPTLHVNINATGHCQRTPLHIACFKGHSEHVDLLLHSFEIDINATDNDGNTSLHIASMKGCYDVVKRIKSVPWCKIDVRNRHNRSPLDVSPISLKIAETVDVGSLTDLKNILEQNDVQYNDKSNNTLLHICASSKLLAGEKAKLLVDRYPEMLYKTNQMGYMPIHIAASEDNEDVAECLAKNGCLNVITVDKQSPLHIASDCNSYSTLVKLLKFDNVLVNNQDNNKNTPAHIAAMHDQLDMLSVIENDPKYIHGMCNDQGKTPHEMCPILNSLKQMFLSGSASSVKESIFHWRKCLLMPIEKMLIPVILQITHEKVEKLKILLDYFQDSIEKYTDSNGYSLIHLAVFAKELHFLQVLLNSLPLSESINGIDSSGNTAWDYASLKQDIATIQQLEAHRRFKQVL